MRKKQSVVILMSGIVLFCIASMLVSTILAPKGLTDFNLYNSAEMYVMSSGTKTSAPTVSAEAAVLLDAKSGKVLFEKNSHKVLPMASTTKIMTAKIILDCLPLDIVVTVPKEATLIEGSSMYLRENEQITVEHLLYGLLLESGNDAAHTLATALSGSTAKFSELMNKTVKDMGLTYTSFANPHGLTAENHHTTAYELAYITMCAMRNPVFRKIVSTKTKTISSIDGEVTRFLSNHNRMLRSYNGAIGVKTGYTIASGRCLVSAAERNDSLLIAVTLNDRNDWNDHTEMLNYGFNNFSSVCVAKSKEFQIFKKGLCYTNTEDVYLTLPASQKTELSYTAEVNEGSGKVTYYSNGKESGTFTLTPQSNQKDLL